MRLVTASGIEPCRRPQLLTTNMRYDAARTHTDPHVHLALRADASRPRWIAGIILFLLAAASAELRAQITVYPPVLYSGDNVLTINAPNGLNKVTGYIGGRWTNLVTGLSAPYIRITSGVTFVQCGKRVTFGVLLKTTRPIGLLQLRIEDCKGNIKYFDFRDSETWNVYREDFGNVPQGSNACHTFRVEARGTNIIIDSVASRSPLFAIRYTNGRPPLRIRGGQVYEYDVCFDAKNLGYVKMPILVYIRRAYPAGGHTNFIVADTAHVNVVSPAGKRPPPIAAVTKRKRPPSRELIAQPPLIVIAPPKDTVRVIPKVIPTVARSVPVIPDTLRATPRAETEEPLNIIAERVTDPTTHRTILLPTARPIDSGRIALSNYDIVGWLFGYGLTDRLSLLGGFLYVPRFIDYNVVGTIGGRYELYREGLIRGAVGLQGNYSQSDLSTIILVSPYAVISVGDDDRRASLALGYTWRHHTPKEGGPFDRQAAVLGIGGDYRVGDNWKVAAEGYILQSANYQPLVVTLRYFTDRFAIDAGVGVAAGEGGTVEAAPVLTGTWVW